MLYAKAILLDFFNIDFVFYLSTYFYLMIWGLEQL